MRRYLNFVLFATTYLGAACGAPLEPNLSAIQEHVFTPSCTFSSCHDAVAPEHELDLTSANAFTSLMEGTSPDTDIARVTPGDAENSLLYLSLVGTAPKDIRTMPLGGGLSDDEIDAIRTIKSENIIPRFI